MGKKVICYIQAFDCEETVEAAMRSVLNQTYQNWLCFVLSNGNQNTLRTPNATFDVIRAVAARDPRFIVLNKEWNAVNRSLPMLYCLAKWFPDAYICALDADDEYESDFFERAVALAEAHGLSIVACGTEILLKKEMGATEATLLSRRQRGEDLVLRSEAYTKYFPAYKSFFNELWGKLYDTNLFGPGYDERYAVRHYFGCFVPDTLFTIDCLSRSPAMGVLSGTSHKFYQYERRKVSNATQLVNAGVANRTRFPWDRANPYSVYDSYDRIMEFLRAHGEIDDGVYEYMQAVLFGWFGDYYARVLVMTADEAKLEKHVRELVFRPKFEKLMRYQGSGKYQNIQTYEKRIEFCERLRYLLAGQEGLDNRQRFGRSVRCSGATLRKLEKTAGKLEEMLRMLRDLQAATEERKS